MHQNRGSILGLKDDRLDLQIRSPPFRLKINESQTSSPNFRSIGPQTKRDHAFDEIWAVKKKLCFSLQKWWFSPSLSFLFLSLFLLSPVAAKNWKKKKKKGFFFKPFYIEAKEALNFRLSILGCHMRKNPTMFPIRGKFSCMLCMMMMICQGT